VQGVGRYGISPTPTAHTLTPTTSLLQPMCVHPPITTMSTYSMCYGNITAPLLSTLHPNIVNCWTNSGTGHCNHNRGWLKGWGIRLSIVTKIYLPSPLPPC
jgi:hypothetical protein